MLNLTQRCLPVAISIFLCLPMVACNTEITGVGKISSTELLTKINSKQAPLIIDVRSKEEYEEGHIPGAVNIEFRKLKDSIEMIAGLKDARIVVYCERGIRAAIAEITLQNEGFQTILHLEGDMLNWRKNSLPIAKN